MKEVHAEKHVLDLSDITLEGRILDIGGGGEGVISRLAGESVIAIDSRKEELEETADIGIKIVMDACALTFLDDAFDTVTCFYSLMYMDADSIKKSIEEAYRVMKPGGLLWIWDGAIPVLDHKTIYIIPLEITLKHETINTGYGIGWSREQTMRGILDISIEAGFLLEQHDDMGTRFELRLKKGASNP